MLHTLPSHGGSSSPSRGASARAERVADPVRSRRGGAADPQHTECRVAAALGCPGLRYRVPRLSRGRRHGAILACGHALAGAPRRLAGHAAPQASADVVALFLAVPSVASPPDRLARCWPPPRLQRLPHGLEAVAQARDRSESSAEIGPLGVQRRTGRTRDQFSLQRGAPFRFAADCPQELRPSRPAPSGQPLRGDKERQTAGTCGEELRATGECAGQPPQVVRRFCVVAIPGRALRQFLRPPVQRERLPESPGQTPDPGHGGGAEALLPDDPGGGEDPDRRELVPQWQKA